MSLLKTEKLNSNDLANCSDLANYIARTSNIQFCAPLSASIPPQLIAEINRRFKLQQDSTERQQKNLNELSPLSFKKY